MTIVKETHYVVNKSTFGKPFTGEIFDSPYNAVVADSANYLSTIQKEALSGLLIWNGIKLEHDQLTQLIASLQWLADETKPDPVKENDW